MKKTVKIWGDVGITSFEYDYLVDLQEEFESNRIKIGSHTTIGDNTMLGNGVTIGSYTTIGDNVTINDNVTIGQSVRIDECASIVSGAFIGESSVISAHHKCEAVIYIAAQKHSITYAGEDLINIGMKNESIKWWVDNLESWATWSKYSIDEIAQYGVFIQMIANLHNSKR